MTKITEKQLIEQISALKEIKPRKEWAVLLKSTLLENKVPGRMIGTNYAQRVSFIDIFSSIFSQRKLAYSFAVILLFVIGVFGFTKLLPNDKIPTQTASVTVQTASKQNVADLNTKISELAKATKNSNVAVKDVNDKVSALAKSLKNNKVTDPQTIKEIAKTLADVKSTDLTENSDIKDLYQTIVKNQIAEEKNTTLTDEQKQTLAEVEDLYNQGKYYEAFEKTLLDQQVND